MFEWLKPSGECLECRALFIGDGKDIEYESNNVYRVLVFIREGRIWLRCRSHHDRPYDAISALLKEWRFL